MTTSERIEKAAQSELLKGLARIFALIGAPVFVALVGWSLIRLSAQADTMLAIQLSLRDLTNAVAGLQAQAQQQQQTVATNQKSADERRDKVDTRFSEQGASIGALSARADQRDEDLRRIGSQVATTAADVGSISRDQAVMKATLDNIEKALNRIVEPSTVQLPGDSRKR